MILVLMEVVMVRTKYNKRVEQLIFNKLISFFNCVNNLYLEDSVVESANRSMIATTQNARAPNRSEYFINLEI